MSVTSAGGYAYTAMAKQRKGIYFQSEKIELLLTVKVEKMCLEL